MTGWFSGRDARERLARLEDGVAQQTAVSGRQAQALAALEAAVAELTRQVTRMDERAAADAARTKAAIDATRVEVERRLEQVGVALKRNTGTDKRVMGTVSEQMKRLLGRLARVSPSLDPSLDARFIDVAQPLVDSRRTMLGYDRLFTLWQAARNVAPLRLPAVEVGTFRGGSAALVAQALRDEGADGEVHVVDTFEGHLDSTFTGHDPEQQRGKFKETSVDDVRAFLSTYPGVHVYQGDGPTVVRGWPERQYGFVHLDVDLYQPTLACLDYFGGRMASGGAVVLDDYEAATCPGVAVAAHEYLAAHPVFQTWRLQAEQLLLVRR